MQKRSLGTTCSVGVLIALCVVGATALTLSGAQSEASAQTGPPKPRVPPGQDPGGIAVAVIGAGVDYRRPEIAAQIARDGEGEIIAWDVIDDDARPLEAAPVAGRHVPPHAGTAMVAYLLAEAPRARLIPRRVPDANPLALGGALACVAQTPARIVVLLTGADANPQPQSWALFTGTARRARHLLIIVTAGYHDGDGKVLAPQNLGLDNMIVVTAADNEGRIADGAGWGGERVDIAIAVAPDAVPPPDAHDRATALANIAGMHLAALAARLAAHAPGLDGPGLKARLLAHAKPLPGMPAKRMRAGWIENPRQIQNPN